MSSSDEEIPLIERSTRYKMEVLEDSGKSRKVLVKKIPIYPPSPVSSPRRAKKPQIEKMIVDIPNQDEADNIPEDNRSPKKVQRKSLDLKLKANDISNILNVDDDDDIDIVDLSDEDVDVGKERGTRNRSEERSRRTPLKTRSPLKEKSQEQQNGTAKLDAWLARIASMPLEKVDNRSWRQREIPAKTPEDKRKHLFHQLPKRERCMIHGTPSRFKLSDSSSSRGSPRIARGSPEKVSRQLPNEIREEVASPSKQTQTSSMLQSSKSVKRKLYKLDEAETGRARNESTPSKRVNQNSHRKQLPVSDSEEDNNRAILGSPSRDRSHHSNSARKMKSTKIIRDESSSEGGKLGSTNDKHSRSSSTISPRKNDNNRSGKRGVPSRRLIISSDEESESHADFRRKAAFTKEARNRGSDQRVNDDLPQGSGSEVSEAFKRVAAKLFNSPIQRSSPKKRNPKYKDIYSESTSDSSSEEENLQSLASRKSPRLKPISSHGLSSRIRRSARERKKLNYNFGGSESDSDSSVSSSRERNRKSRTDSKNNDISSRSRGDQAGMPKEINSERSRSQREGSRTLNSKHDDSPVQRSTRKDLNYKESYSVSNDTRKPKSHDSQKKSKQILLEKSVGGSGRKENSLKNIDDGQDSSDDTSERSMERWGNNKELRKRTSSVRRNLLETSIRRSARNNDPNNSEQLSPWRSTRERKPIRYNFGEGESDSETESVSRSKRKPADSSSDDEISLQNSRSKLKETSSSKKGSSEVRSKSLRGDATPSKYKDDEQMVRRVARKNDLSASKNSPWRSSRNRKPSRYRLDEDDGNSKSKSSNHSKRKPSYSSSEEEIMLENLRTKQKGSPRSNKVSSEVQHKKQRADGTPLKNKDNNQRVTSEKDYSSVQNNSDRSSRHSTRERNPNLNKDECKSDSKPKSSGRSKRETSYSSSEDEIILENSRTTQKQTPSSKKLFPEVSGKKQGGDATPLRSKDVNQRLGSEGSKALNNQESPVRKSARSLRESESDSSGQENSRDKPRTKAIQKAPENKQKSSDSSNSSPARQSTRKRKPPKRYSDDEEGSNSSSMLSAKGSRTPLAKRLQNELVASPARKRQLATPAKKTSNDSDSEAFVTKMSSPKTPRTPKAGLLTPSSRKNLARRGLLTPSMPSRDRSVSTPKTPQQEAMSRLHVSAVPRSLPCREKEYADIYRFIEGKLLDNAGGCMYISGTPGTGKTATVREVVESLRQAVFRKELPDFQFIEMNAMSLTEPRQAYVFILKALTGEKVSTEQAQRTLEKMFTRSIKRKTNKSIVLMVDELDILWTRREDVVYNLLDWPTKVGSRFIVLTIANTMDMPERMLKGRVTSRMGLTRLTFQPYTFKQLEKIVQSRLEGIKAFDSDAVQLVSRKVASVSGDARRALDICRRATELAELDGRDVLVSITHVDVAVREMLSSSKLQALQACSKVELLFMKAVMTEVERTGIEETRFFKVYKMLGALCVLDGLEVPNVSQAMKACNSLGSMRLLLTEHSRSDIQQRILLNVNAEDVRYTLKEMMGG